MSETPSHLSHRREAPENLSIALITVSDTRTLDDDRSGALMVSMLENAGHGIVARRIVPDDPGAIKAAIMESLSLQGCDAALLSGGTGVGLRDRTAGVVKDLCEKMIPGFGELFRMLSYEEIGAAAMLSGALAGTLGEQAIVAMPGSPGGVKLAMEKLVLPELGLILRDARRRA
ncbi:molybdenum cofactor biosynthesis protein MoaB [bacterium]|nr:molybdenum cofactor biosynthesis protein MoaB [bacterium]